MDTHALPPLIRVVPRLVPTYNTGRLVLAHELVHMHFCNARILLIGCSEQDECIRTADARTRPPIKPRAVWRWWEGRPSQRQYTLMAASRPAFLPCQETQPRGAVPRGCWRSDRRLINILAKQYWPRGAMTFTAKLILRFELSRSII